MNANRKVAYVSILALVAAVIAIVIAVLAMTGVFSSKDQPAGAGATPSNGTSPSETTTPPATASEQPSESSSALPTEPAEPSSEPSGEPTSGALSPAPLPPPPATGVPGIPDKEADGARPAPGGVMWKDRYAFFSPTHNIYCEMSPDVVNCGILQRNYTPPMPCENSFHMIELSADSGAMRESCIMGNPGLDTEVLAYGMSACTGNLTCLSQEAGVVCWNNRLANGFLMNRDGITKF